MHQIDFSPNDVKNNAKFLITMEEMKTNEQFELNQTYFWVTRNNRDLNSGLNSIVRKLQFAPMLWVATLIVHSIFIKDLNSRM